ncbi:MAG TPA: response regulator transcription factor [Thermoanaerobaculia bacterium]|nr:response regulator transcription factor [Thermoanaerobaculia bacterium]
MRGLVVEDDDRLRSSISRTAARAGVAVDEAPNIEDAEMLLDIHPYEILILDRRLPDGDGLDLCRKARHRGFGNSILMLTALDDPQSMVEGLAEGADDYIGKPFDIDVLEARIKALLRRNQRTPAMELTFGDLTLRPWKRQLHCGANEVRLTAREFAIIETLMRAPEGAISREELLEHAWGEREEPMSNTIDVLMARIRKKLGAAGSRVRVETVRGAGYRLSA